MLKTKDLFDLSHTRAAELLAGTEYPWEALAKIGDLILELGKNLPKDEFDEVSEHVWIAKDAKIYPNNYIAGPCIIGHGTEVRPGAFIRGNALVGDNCVVGNSTELKNVILFDNVQVPHYNYVGDSILGYKSHMGAGSLTSNVKSDKKPVVVKCGEERMDRDRDEEVRRHGGRPGGSRMQQRPEPRNRRRPGQQYLPDKLCPRHGAGSLHLEEYGQDRREKDGLTVCRSALRGAKAG